MADIYFGLPNEAYIPTAEVVKLAEEKLEHELRAAEEFCSDNYLECCGVRITAEDARNIYESLEWGKEDVSNLARRFVGMVKRYIPYTSYNFDDALVDVMRVGIFLSGKTINQPLLKGLGA